MKTPQEQIDEIMNEFMFERVHTAMVALGWQWKDAGVPSLPTIRVHAQILLHEVVDRDLACIETGGFEAACDEGCLSLVFTLESWAYEPSEDI